MNLLVLLSRDIIFYIADDSGSVDIALNYLDKIEKAINNLKDFLYSGSVPHYATLRRQGYRVLIVERHLVFYKVNESQQIVTITLSWTADGNTGNYYNIVRFRYRSRSCPRKSRKIWLLHALSTSSMINTIGLSEFAQRSVR